MTEQQTSRARDLRVSNRPCIRGEASAGKSLVGAVKEWEQFLLLNKVGDFDPLLLTRIDSCWIVCTSLENYDGIFRSSFEVSNHCVKIEHFFVVIPVPVLPTNLETGTLEDESCMPRILGSLCLDVDLP